MPDVCFVALTVRLNSHLINEDLSLHPSEQKSLPSPQQVKITCWGPRVAGDPESMGTPVSTPSTKTCPFTPASKNRSPGTPSRWGPRYPPHRRRPVPPPQRAKIARRGPRVDGDPGEVVP